jgi:hypothetical protein
MSTVVSEDPATTLHPVCHWTPYKSGGQCAGVRTPGLPRRVFAEPMQAAKRQAGIPLDAQARHEQDQRVTKGGSRQPHTQALQALDPQNSHIVGRTPRPAPFVSALPSTHALKS